MGKTILCYIRRFANALYFTLRIHSLLCKKERSSLATNHPLLETHNNFFENLPLLILSQRNRKIRKFALMQTKFYKNTKRNRRREKFFQLISS